MRTLDEYAQKWRREAWAKAHVKEEQLKVDETAKLHKEKYRLGLERLHVEWDAVVRDLLEQAGQIVWPRDGHWLVRWIRRFRVLSEQHDLRWRLLHRRQRTHDDGSILRTYALGYEVRLTDTGFELSAGGVTIRSAFDRASLEDAIVQLLGVEPEGRELLIRSERFHQWFITSENQA